MQVIEQVSTKFNCKLQFSVCWYRSCWSQVGPQVFNQINVHLYNFLLFRLFWLRRRLENRLLNSMRLVNFYSWSLRQVNVMHNPVAITPLRVQFLVQHSQLIVIELALRLDELRVHKL